MVKAKEVKSYEVVCPECKRTFVTLKEKDIQCYGCHKRFDI